MKFQLIADELIKRVTSQHPIKFKSQMSPAEYADKLTIQIKRAESIEDTINKILSEEGFKLSTDDDPQKLREFLDPAVVKLITGQI